MMVAVCNAGLHIVYNLDEVTFVQNLVYYIEEAYRIPVSHIAPVQTSLCSSVPTRTMVYGSVVTRPIMGRHTATIIFQHIYYTYQKQSSVRASTKTVM